MDHHPPRMDGPARLLLVAQPVDGGVPQHVGDLAESLDASRFSVEVACPVESLLWKRLEQAPGIRLLKIGPARGPALGDVRSMASLMGAVASADIVHAHSTKAGLLVRALAASRRRIERCVFTPHGWSFWSMTGTGRRAALLMERGLARWCSRIVAVSQAERDAGLGEGVGRPGQYRVITNGIDVDHFDRPRRPAPGRVLAIGRLAHQKRPDLILAAMRDVIEAHPGARLDFVGEGPLRGDIERDVARRGLSSRVRLLGERGDIAELLSEAACMVLASDYESLPLSLIEAMAAGVPVIAADVGGTREVVVDGRMGVLIEPGRPKTLAAAIIGVLGDPATAEMMGAAGRARAREAFTRSAMVEATTAVYNEILGLKATPASGGEC